MSCDAGARGAANAAIEDQKSRLLGRRDAARGARKPTVRADEAVLAVFAHDIRTALTGILALGELLASSNLGERERRWAAGIKDSAEHLASLTTLAIDAAKADAGTLTLQQEIFRPRRLIEAVAETLAARAQTKGLGAEGDGRQRSARICWWAIRCGCGRRWKISSTTR